MRRISLSITALLLICQAWSQVHQDTAFNSLLRKYNGGWIAGDATFSIALPDGRTLWLFGDSFIGTVNPDSSIVAGSHFIRNCAVLQDGDSMRALYSGTFEDPDAFLVSDDPDSIWYWPEHGLVENDTLKIFFSEFTLANAAPGFNFKYKSAVIAFFSYPEISYLGLHPLPYYELNKVCYGNCLMVDNGYTYVYGRKVTDTIHNIPYPHVARVPVGNLQAPWQFYSGTGWVGDPASTTRIGNVAVSQQYGFFRQNNKYVMISQEIYLSSRIYSYTCTTPQGPLNNKILLYTTPILYPTTFTYNAFPHTQFTEDGDLLVSYNTNGDFWSIFSNVEIYRPLFFRVPLSMIDTSFSTSLPDLNQGRKPGGIQLFQNSPNPVRNSTQVQLQVHSKQYVSLELLDLKGRKIRTYINNTLNPGTYSIQMDLESLTQGVYCYGTGDQFRKLIKD